MSAASPEPAPSTYGPLVPVLLASLAHGPASSAQARHDEINEAFASVAIISARWLGVNPERVNVNGGAIALGHPIGASGARIVVALAHELWRRGGLGLAAICSGTGQGDALIIQVDG